MSAMGKMPSENEVSALYLNWLVQTRTSNGDHDGRDCFAAGYIFGLRKAADEAWANDPDSRLAESLRALADAVEKADGR